jgi:hypothetical protein
MNRLVSFVALSVVGLVVLAAVGPTLLRLVHAAVPLVLVAGVVVGVLRAVWFYTR